MQQTEVYQDAKGVWRTRGLGAVDAASAPTTPYENPAANVLSAVYGLAPYVVIGGAATWVIAKDKKTKRAGKRLAAASVGLLAGGFAFGVAGALIGAVVGASVT